MASWTDRSSFPIKSSKDCPPSSQRRLCTALSSRPAVPAMAGTCASSFSRLLVANLKVLSPSLSSAGQGEPAGALLTPLLASPLLLSPLLLSPLLPLPLPLPPPLLLLPPPPPPPPSLLLLLLLSPLLMLAAVPSPPPLFFIARSKVCTHGTQS